MSIAFGLPLDFYSIFIIVGVMFGVVTLIPSLIPGNLGTKEAFLMILLGSGQWELNFLLYLFQYGQSMWDFRLLLGQVLI